MTLTNNDGVTSLEEGDCSLETVALATEGQDYQAASRAGLETDLFNVSWFIRS